MTNVDKKNLFENFNAIRIKKNLTFQDVSDKAGISRKNLYNLKKHKASHDTITKIAQALEVSADELLGLEAPIDENKPKLFELPVWKIENYKNSDYLIRYLADSTGKNSFGIILKPRDSGYPKGTIFYFNPDLEPEDSDLVLIKVDNKVLVKKYYFEDNKIRLKHLLFDDLENYSEFEILGTCVLITIDRYLSKSD